MGSSIVRRDLKLSDAVIRACDSKLGIKSRSSSYSIYEALDGKETGTWTKAVDGEKTFASENIVSGETLILQLVEPSSQVRYYNIAMVSIHTVCTLLAADSRGFPAVGQQFWNLGSPSAFENFEIITVYCNNMIRSDTPAWTSDICAISASHMFLLIACKSYETQRDERALPFKGQEASPWHSNLAVSNLSHMLTETQWICPEWCSVAICMMIESASWILSCDRRKIYSHAVFLT